MEQLPTPRQFLSSLLSSLPTPSAVPSAGPTPQNTQSSNPLKSLAQPSRNILLTLHMLYPSLLLHSLDLLDRGLVTKITQTLDSSQDNPPPSRIQDQDHLGLGEEKDNEVDNPKTLNSFYLVSSSQTPAVHRSRFHQSNKSTSTSLKTYHVHLNAWNCSCAAFVFSAFPPVPSTYDSDFSLPGDDAISLDCGGVRVKEGGFGGMSFDGMYRGDGKDGGVAMCKHLLACLLVERWGEVLGVYLKDKVVGREEMAGLGADV